MKLVIEGLFLKASMESIVYFLALFLLTGKFGTKSEKS